MILTNDEEIAKEDQFRGLPGLQGGPLMHVIAAKAVALGEACSPPSRIMRPRSSRTPHLAETLKANGLDIVSGGTDNHLMLVDLRKKNATGKRAEAALGRAYVTATRRHSLRPEKPFVTSGVRLGAPAGTTRGFKEAEFKEIGRTDRRGARRSQGRQFRTRAMPQSRLACARR